MVSHIEAPTVVARAEVQFAAADGAEPLHRTGAVDLEFGIELRSRDQQPIEPVGVFLDLHRERLRWKLDSLPGPLGSRRPGPFLRLVIDDLSQRVTQKNE